MADEGSGGGPDEADDEAAARAARDRGKKKPKSVPKLDKARRRDTRAAATEDEDLEKAGRKPPWMKDGENDEDTEDEDRAAKAVEDETEDDEDEDEGEDGDETEKADEDEEDEEDEEETKKAKEDEDDDDDDDDDAAERTGPRAKPAAKAERRLVMPATARTAALRVLAKALERLMGVAQRINKAGEPDDKTEEVVPGDVASELGAIGELLEDVTGQLRAAKVGASKAGVAKAGRRMAKERLDRFQKALALLSDVLQELTQAQQAAEPTGGRTDQTQKRFAAPGMGALVASVTELTQIMKGQQDELARLRKTRATSNALPVDGGRRGVSQDVSWPLDMNRPISRDGVAKATSFYDD